MRLPVPSDSARGASPAPASLMLAGGVLLLIWTGTRLVTDKPADYAAQLLVLLCLIVLATRPHPLRQAAVLKLFVAALALQLLTWALSHAVAPELAERSPKLERLAGWFFLIPVALFTGDRQRRVLTLWSVALAGLLLIPWTSGEGWAEIQRGLSGERVDFGVINAQHTGMLFGVALLGSGLFLPRVRRFGHDFHAAWLAAPWAAIIAVCAGGVIITQTRGVWLGLLVTIPLILMLRARLHGRRQGVRAADPPRTRWQAYLLTSSLLLLMAFFFVGTVSERIAFENPFAAFRSTERERGSTVKEPVLVRLSTWREALHWIGERPLLGWGGNGRELVVDATPELSASEKARFRHLHSTYLDTLVNFGLAGLLLWLSLLASLTRAVMRAWREQRIAGDLLVFWLAFLLYWLVVNLFESFMYYDTGMYIFALIAGGYVTLTLPRAAGFALPANAVSRT